MSNIPPSQSNPLGSIETNIQHKDPHKSIKVDEEQDKQSTSIPTDLLKIRIEQIKENAPKSKEQFYQHSFKIFSKLNAFIKGSDLIALKDSIKSQISHIVSEYVDLVHEYPDTSKLTPLWDLSNLLYFSTEDNHLVTDLNNWINGHDPILDHREEGEYEEGEDLSWVWETSRRHLLRGNLVEAVTTLEYVLHALDKTEGTAIKNIIGLVQKFDLLQQDNQHNTRAYAENWTAWHTECEDTLETFMAVRDKDREIDKYIIMLYNVLFGDEESIFLAGSYFERVIGSILYSRPTITVSGLAQLAQHAVGKDTKVDICAYILMGCFDDAFEASNDLWLQTHLGHALIAVGAKSSSTIEHQKKSEDQEVVLDPIYYCINAYATMIAETNNMWKEAVVYTSACVENREIWTKKLLGDPPFQSKDMSLLKSVLDIANHEKMPGVKRYMYRIIGQRYEHKKDIHQATIEYGKAHDFKSLDRFAHEEFSQYLESGKLVNVVTDMDELKASPHYAILIIYKQLRTHLENKDWKEASELVLELLKSDHLPTRFETVLLIDNLVILEESKQYYSREELLKLIDIFKQITKDESNAEFISKYYKMTHRKDLSAVIVSAKLRERIAYKAATATSATY